MASAFDGGTADLARALTSAPPPRRDSGSSSGHAAGGYDAGSFLLSAAASTTTSATPPRSRHSSSSSGAAARVRREAEFVSVRGTPTHLVKYGAFDASTRTLVLVVPGNPGVPEYYDHFMETLHLASGQTLPVWCISHAGHVLGDDDDDDDDDTTTTRTKMKTTTHLPPFDQNDSHRSLRGQVDHKLAFIQDHVMLTYRKLVSPALDDDDRVGRPLDGGADDASDGAPSSVPDLKLILIGHSIGCWMICEMIKKMKPDLKKQILKAFLLFPTIERMALSPNGRFLTPLVTYIPSWILAFPLHLFRLLPLSWRRFLVRFYFRGRGHIPDCVYRATLTLARPQSVANSLHLYYEEAYTVIEPDLDFIQANSSKLRFYYGTTDAWVPISYYREMKELFPDGDIRLCEEGYEHAFVIRSSEEMALVVWGWVLELFEQ